MIKHVKYKTVLHFGSFELDSPALKQYLIGFNYWVYMYALYVSPSPIRQFKK